MTSTERAKSREMSEQDELADALLDIEGYCITSRSVDPVFRGLILSRIRAIPSVAQAYANAQVYRKQQLLTANAVESGS